MAKGYSRDFPFGTKRITTGCQYCAVGCGYNAFLVPANEQSGDPEPLTGVSRFITPAMTGTVRLRGEPYRAAIAPDPRCDLNKGNHSVRGGSQGENLVTADGSGRSTGDRLRSPKVRLADGSLAEITWSELNQILARLLIRATGIAPTADATESLDVARPEALGVKLYEYQYLENTYAATKLFYSAIGTPNLAYHDRPSAAGSSPGMADAGLGPHDFAYEDLREADVVLMLGTNPYENQSVFFMQHCAGKEIVVLDPRRTATAQYATGTGGLHLQPTRLGADSLVLYALARAVIEAWERHHPEMPFPLRLAIGDPASLAAGASSADKKRQASRVMDWAQFRSFLGVGETGGTYSLANAAQVAAIRGGEQQLAEVVSRLFRGAASAEEQPRVAILYEKGLIWGFNYANTAAVASLGVLLGSYGEPGRLTGRVGGHQKGWAECRVPVAAFSGSGGGYPYAAATDRYSDSWLATTFPENPTIKTRHNLDNHVFGPPPNDRHADQSTVPEGSVRLTNGLVTQVDPDVTLLWIIGGNYLGQTHDAQRKRQVLAARLAVGGDGEGVRRPLASDLASPDRVEKVVSALGERIDAGGLVLIHQDLFPHSTTELCDLIIPAAGWGEDSFCRYNAQRRLKLYERFQDMPLHDDDAADLAAGENRDPMGQVDTFRHSPKPDWRIFRDLAHAVARELGTAEAALGKAFAWQGAAEVADAMAEESNRGRAGADANGRSMLGDLLAFAEARGVERHRVHTVLGRSDVPGNEDGMAGHLKAYSVTGDGAAASPIYGNGVASNGVLLPVRSAIGENGEARLEGTLRVKRNGPFFFVRAPWTEIEPFFRRLTPQDDEVFVTNGRVNHLWNNLFHHLRNDYVNQRYPADLPGTLLEVNPDWAARRRIGDGALVEVEGPGGSFRAIASLQDSVPDGGAFAMFSYPVRNEAGSFGFDGYANNTTDGYADGINPIGALKYGRARVEKVADAASPALPTYEARNRIRHPDQGFDPRREEPPPGGWGSNQRLDWELREILVARGLPRAGLHGRSRPEPQATEFLTPESLIRRLADPEEDTLRRKLQSAVSWMLWSEGGVLLDRWHDPDLHFVKNRWFGSFGPETPDPDPDGRESEMNRFERVLQILDRTIGGPDAEIGVHGAFWRGKSRDELIAERIFGLLVIVVGDGALSNLVKALRGEAPFGADTGTPGASFRRMPAGMDPATESEIAFISTWIDDGCPDDEEDVEGPQGEDEVEGGPESLLEVRLLPPLAIARLGSSPDPMDNYDTIEPEEPTGFRQLEPAETLKVEGTGVASAGNPEAVRFRDDGGRIRPVAPFLELWARFLDDGPLEPLTLNHLQALGGSAQSVSWTVRVANLKAFRRTGAPGDRISASVLGFRDHARKPLRGRAPNLRTDRFIPLGSVQYLEPNEAFPEIRLRFTPAQGGVFGHQPDFPELGVVYDPARGQWDDHDDARPPANSPTPRARVATAPPNIYARHQGPGPNQGRNLGYLDDTCDGIVEVAVSLGTRVLTARARISSGPPDFAPDSFHVRTVADELEQMALGPTIEGEVEEEELADKVTDTVVRALETVRLSDTANLNVLYGRPFPEARARYPIATDTHAALRRSLQGLRSPAGSQERRDAVNQLQRILTFLRTYDAATDFSTAGTRRMPALMRGADAGRLALTRRQRNLIEEAIAVFGETAGATPEAAMLRLVSVLGPGATFFHGAFSLDEGPALSERLTDPPQTLAYLRQAAAQGAVASQLGLAGRPLVVPGRPDESAFIELLRNPQHPMNGPFTNYVDPESGGNGIEIVRAWIESLLA